MKSTQLLSVVFSLIMFTGVTAGNTAFAESDEIDDILEDFCEMTLDERSATLSKYDLDDYSEKLEIICNIEDKDERENSLESVIDALELEYDETYDDNDRHDDVDFDLDDLLDDYCEINDVDKRQLLADHPRLAPFTDRLANYCNLSDDEQDVIDELIKEHGDKIRHELRDYKDDYGVNHENDMRVMLDRYCEMSDEDKITHVTEHDKAEDHVDKMNRFCALTDEDSRMNFIQEHKGEYMEHMKDKIHDMKSGHMDYDRLCKMLESERASEITDVDKLERISDWCEMTPAEREDYKDEHHDKVKDHCDGDDCSMHDRMSEHCDGDDCPMMDKKHEMKEKHHEKMEKDSEKSDRLKAMIMDKRDISDERHDEIKMKFEEKHGEDSDKKRSEIKMKYKDHVKHMKFKMSDERKSDVHDRLAEMKAYKAELRENSSELSDEEKQQLREEFIEKAKDMQLAWISPRTQMTAGIDSAEVECREGFSLVMKASNGVAMCLKADTALKMIDRGIVVPAN